MRSPAAGLDDAAVAELARALGAERRRTHGSWVLLFDDDRVLKIKRPVRYSFMDYSTLERRLASCIAEVEVNDELAPGIYRGVRALLERNGEIVVGPMGSRRDAVDYAVEMRRYDERGTMASLLAAGRLEKRHVDAVAVRIAGFHAGQPACRTGGATTAFELRLDADLHDVERLIPASRVAAHRRFGAALLRRHADRLDDRARRGMHRDGHGDLRADHVLFDDDAVLVVDRIEFDPALRCADVADDLAFLLMDLEHRGARWAADALAAAYGAAGGDPADPSLRAGFAWRRALVAAKTALLADDPRRAEGLLSLADRLAWRSRAPVIVAVSGPPASGKSTLAAALAERLELPVVASDAIRKGLLGLGATEPAPESGYAPEVTERVYAELAGRAATETAAHGGVVVDATFRTGATRNLIERLGDDVRWIWLDAAPETLRERARDRSAGPPGPSDADERVAAALASSFEPLDELPADRVCRLDATRSPEELVAAFAGFLDR